MGKIKLNTAKRNRPQTVTATTIPPAMLSKKLEPALQLGPDGRQIATSLHDSDGSTTQVQGRYGKKLKRKRSPKPLKRPRSKSITPPPAIPQYQLENARQVIRQTLGNHRESSPEAQDSYEEEETFVFDPQLAKIAQSVKSQSEIAGPSRASLDPNGNDVINITVGWEPHPLKEHEKRDVWRFKLDRTDNFSELFESVAEEAGILLEKLVMTYRGKRFFSSVSPQTLNIWSDAELTACDSVTFEFNRNTAQEQLRSQAQPSTKPVRPTASEPTDVIEFASDSDGDEDDLHSAKPSQIEQATDTGRTLAMGADAGDDDEGNKFRLVLRSSLTPNTISLNVRSTTKCGAIVKAYLKKAGLADKYPAVFEGASAPTPQKRKSSRKSAAVDNKIPQLSIDGDKAGIESMIGEYDLEEGDMVEVVDLYLGLRVAWLAVFVVQQRRTVRSSSKPKPAQRTREISPEEDADDESGTTAIDTTTIGASENTESPLSAVKKFKDRTKKSQPKSRLSFGAEEHDPVSVATAELKRVLRACMWDGPGCPVWRNIPDNLDQATISPSRHSGPTYDKAYLNELKKSTPSARAPTPTTLDPYDADMSMDVSIDLGDVDAVDAGGESETLIQTESVIKQAKERREHSRKTGISTSEDYISLSVTRRSEHQGPHPESRLVREEDEVGEGDDEFAEYTSAQERIALGKKSRKAEASKRREMMQEMISETMAYLAALSRVDEDEESVEWEQEQLRRGGHHNLDSTSSKSKPRRTYAPAPIPPTTPLPTLPDALARITHRLAQLTASHASNTASLNTFAQEREQVDIREQELRELVTKAEEKRAWFSSFSDWVESVAAFLDEKYPLLEKLEDKFASLLEERHAIIIKRRLQDLEDDLSTFLSPSPGASPDTTAKETSDEFGRASCQEHPIVSRRERQTQRGVRYRNYLDSKGGKADVDQGYWTDSHLSLPDEAAYQTAISSVANQTHDILVDVKSKEFLDPAKGRWGSWKSQYEESYVAAFGGLGVVSAWEFWESKSLDRFRWYHSLYEFCRSRTANDEERELGPEGDLVSSMVSTAIIPRLAKVIESGALDVYSSAHIRRVVDLAEELEASVSDVDKGNLKLQTFYKAVIACFTKAVLENEILLAKHVTTSGSLAFDPEAISARNRFLATQLKLVSNLLRWRKSTGELFGVGQLILRIVDGAMLNIADGGWDVGGEEAIKKLAALLPGDLLTVAIKSRLSIA
ncbi:hypothetical protein D9757_003414 [Collybiopsis confluens]|uniref:Rad60/SUMO-like domain-containing protein n=1 Tax=Collybiopsis confluens TaxID=2823264 RepID=A0A8H5HTC3_9AGAR|nr:hypothetical protein D9757_003414 [Collybiopsis confluens]